MPVRTRKTPVVMAMVAGLRHSQRPLRPPLHGLHRHDRRNPALRRRLRCRHDLHNDPVFDRHAAACVPEFIIHWQIKSAPSFLPEMMELLLSVMEIANFF